MWEHMAQDNVLCYAETIDLSGEIHTAFVLHGEFPVEIIPPYVLSQSLTPVDEGIVEFVDNPLVVGEETLDSLSRDAGGRARVEVPLSALERWREEAEEWIFRLAEKEANKLLREEEKARRREKRSREWAERAEKARKDREAEEARVRAAKQEREEREAVAKAEEDKVRAEAIAAYEAAEEARKAEEEARWKAVEERRKARAAAKVEEARERFVMFWVELAIVAELILERDAAQDPLRPMRQQGGEVVEVSVEGWEVWEYPAGRYAEVEAGEAGEGGEAGEAGEAGEGSEAGEGGVAVHEVEADLPIILNVIRLHVCEDRRAWEDQRGFWVVTGDNLSLHLVTDLEIALAILRKEWRVREAQEFRGEGYCRKVRRQPGWDGRLESAVGALG